MRELSLHILDVVQNSLAAGALLITIRIQESLSQNLLRIAIGDNGQGIAADKIDIVTDPFYTTRSTRRFGLGLSLLQAATLRSGGEFKITSEPGQGTVVIATFLYDDIDRAPMGNIADTIFSLVVGNPGIDFYYQHQYEARIFSFDTQELSIPRSELGIPIVAVKLREYLSEALQQVKLK